MDILNDYLVGANNQVNNTQKKNNAMLDQEGFLKIIAAEISNPSFDGEGGSGSQTDFMGPLIQLSMLDQMSVLTSSIQSTMMMTQQQQALSLVGKQVKVLGLEEGFVVGTVEKARFSNGLASLQIDGTNYSLNDVVEVGDAIDAEEDSKL